MELMHTHILVRGANERRLGQFEFSGEKQQTAGEKTKCVKQIWHQKFPHFAPLTCCRLVTKNPTAGLLWKHVIAPVQSVVLMNSVLRDLFFFNSDLIIFSWFS